MIATLIATVIAAGSLLATLLAADIYLHWRLLKSRRDWDDSMRRLKTASDVREHELASLFAELGRERPSVAQARLLGMLGSANGIGVAGVVLRGRKQ